VQGKRQTPKVYLAPDSRNKELVGHQSMAILGCGKWKKSTMTHYTLETVRQRQLSKQNIHGWVDSGTRLSLLADKVYSSLQSSTL